MNEGLGYLPDMSKLSLDCYVDADFGGIWGVEYANDPISAKPRNGYTLLLDNCLIILVSKLQTLISLSTLEYIYVNISASLRDLLPLRSLLKELDQYLHFGK